MLIVLLGNPGKEYAQTRHNAAWIIGDEAFNNLVWQEDMFTLSSYAKTTIDTFEVIFAKPQTFMNLSGQALAKLIKKFNVAPTDVIVVQDDMDIPLGEFKITQARGAANHNGILSIFNVVGKLVTRVRVGIKPSERSTKLQSFVVQKFMPDELQTLLASSDTFKKIISDIVTGGVVKAMNVWNSK